MLLKKVLRKLSHRVKKMADRRDLDAKNRRLGLRLASIGIENEIYYGKFCCVAVRARPCDVSGQLYLASVLWLS